MRRSVLTSVALLSAFLTTGCEDGPNQSYSAAPSGAAGNWNNGGPDASYNDPGTQGYDSGGGGTNSVNVCTAPQQNAAWTTAFQAPILPPFQVAGIDLSAKGTFSPVTIENVLHGTAGQAQLCQGTAVGCSDGTGSPSYAWGPSQQMQACYDASTHQLTFFLMLPGYDGKLSFKLPTTFQGQPVPLAVDSTGAPAELDFVWQIGKPITVNGQPLTGPMGGPLWSANGIDTKVANQLYLGLMYTFQAALIAVTDATANPPLNEMTDANNNCLATAKCRTSANSDSSQGNFGARSVGIYFDAASSNSTDPASAATPGDMYMYPVKFEPYSLAPYNEGLDTFTKSTNTDPMLSYNGAPIYGPYSPAGVLSPTGATPFCTIYMGETFGDFKNHCINVSGSAATDKTSMAKLLGAQNHAAEWFTFNVVGINQNFSADDAELTQNGQPGVLQDTELQPADDCIASDFYVDVRSSGAKLNDMRGDSKPPSLAVTATDTFEDKHLAGQDMHGTAAVMGYYRALVIDAIKVEMGKVTPKIVPQTDPTKCWFDSTPYTTAAALNKALQAWVAPTGCTGFEQMVIPANPLGTGVWTDNIDFTVEGTFPRSIFQPGDPQLDFYADPVNGQGENNNTSAPNLLQASLSQVTSILGHGNVNSMPPNTRDWRFYLQIWAQAYVGYLLNRSKNPTWHDLYNDHIAAAHTLRQVNQDNLFFDLNAGGIDKFEYVDRDPAKILGYPVDFEYDILISTSNTQDNNFYQRLTRAEKALYTSMLGSGGTSKSDAPGSNENVNLSDLFGSPAIANAGLSAGATDAMGAPIPGKDAWYCATHVDKACPNGPPTDSITGKALLDGEGRPLFTNYRGIFTGTAYTIGSKIPFTSTMPYIASALIALPNYDDPYDTTSNNTPISVLVPWIPPQPGTGFDIPINGQRTQFIQTGTLDFSGVTITTNIDYLPTYDATTGALTGGTIAAAETQDFLGEVFPCVDAASHDILRVKMYTSTADIVAWLEQHPGAQAACNIYVRYSPFGNYPDYITSVTNGVLMSVEPGAGGGPSRIGDATLFNPALLTQTQ